jgi:F-type H+-transporting ATPase subunit delta
VSSKGSLARGYANAVLSLADAEGDLEQVADELFAFAKAAETNTKLREALTDAALPAENKKALTAEILGERSNPHTRNILGFIVEQGRGRDLGVIVDELVKLAADRRRRVVAEVRSAVPLDEKRRASLEKALSEATGKSVEAKVVVDPSVIGGAVARVGAEVFDGSVRTRLREARDLLGSG